MQDIIPQDATPEKRCSKCKQFKPVTAEYFHRSKSKPDGLHDRCKPCRVGEKPRKTPIDDIPEGHKRCTKCKEVFPAIPDYFHAFGHGLQPKCKACRSAYNQENAENMRVYNQQYYQTNKETITQSVQEYRQTHIEWLVQYQIQYAQTHRDAHHEACKKYDQAHPEQVRAKNAKRRARKKAVAGSYTPQDVLDQLKRQHHKCYYAACGFSKFPRVKENGKWKYDYAVEHTFPLSRVAGTDIPANSMSYLVLSCKSCNSKKHDKFPWEWPAGGRLL